MNIDEMNDDVQQEARRLDQDVPLAILDFLDRVEARRIKRRVPFCAPFAICESIIAAVGLEVSTFLLAHRNVQFVMDALRRALLEEHGWDQVQRKPPAKARRRQGLQWTPVKMMPETIRSVKRQGRCGQMKFVLDRARFDATRTHW
jgi:hypothetical protein